MPWDRPIEGHIPPVQLTLQPTVERALREGAQQLSDALAAGTPVRTGAMQSSWRPIQTGPLSFEVAPAVPYGEFVTIDDSAATQIIDDTNRRIGTDVSALFEEA